MRPDVKLGVVVSATVVFVAGVYYMYRDRGEQPIPVATDIDALSQSTGVTPPDDAGPTSKPASTRTRPTTDKAARRPLRGGDNARSSARRSPAANRGGRSGGDRAANRRAAGSTRRATPPRRRTVARPVAPAGENPKTQPKRMASGQPADRPAPTGTPPAGGPSAVTNRPTRAVPLTAKPNAVGHTSNRATGASAAAEVHRVQTGDTFASLAERYYGSAALAGFLQNANRSLGSAVLRPGQRVRIPSRPEVGSVPAGGLPSTGAVRKTPTMASTPGTAKRPKTYRVQPGDSFFSIAKNVLGDASRFNELFELNRKLVKGDPKRLRPGQVVVLPKP